MSLDRLKFLLANAELHIAKCEANIERHKKSLTQIGSNAYDAQTARDAVRQWEELQKLHLANRYRLRQELAALQRHPLVPWQGSDADAWAASVERTIQDVLCLAKSLDETD
jgi:hypothetical protein